MYELKKRVCFTGHRTEKLPNDEENFNVLRKNLKNEIISAIKNDYNTFFTGMSYGFDILAGAIVLDLKKKSYKFDCHSTILWTRKSMAI